MGSPSAVQWGNPPSAFIFQTALALLVMHTMLRAVHKSSLTHWPCAAGLPSAAEAPQLERALFVLYCIVFYFILWSRASISQISENWIAQRKMASPTMEKARASLCVHLLNHPLHRQRQLYLLHWSMDSLFHDLVRNDRGIMMSCYACFRASICCKKWRRLHL